MHPDQAQNTSSGIQGQEATAVAVIYVTAPSLRHLRHCPPDKSYLDTPKIVGDRINF